MRYIFTFVFIVSVFLGFSQQQHLPINSYQQEFEVAYLQYPNIPKGILEAIAYTNTRFRHIQNETQGCSGLPLTYGVMGLTLDGQNYFKNNLKYIAQLSGYTEKQIITQPQINILAFASAYNKLLMQLSLNPTKLENHTTILSTLSELPTNGLYQDFALNSHLYAVYHFLNNKNAQQQYNFPQHQFSMEKIFGKENLKVLSAKYISIGDESIYSDGGIIYQHSNKGNKSPDYPPGIWNPADPSNYSSRSGTAISAVTIHTVQGTYAGCISWFQNPSANVSAHYVLRSSDGQVTQMVSESDKAWHVGSENPYTIGMEHEGWINDSTWYTAAMYQASADVVRDITQSGYGISAMRTAYFPWARFTNYNSAGIPGSCVKIKGHQHYPNQTHTDPGQNWDWDYYFKLINNSSPINNYTASSGTVTDLGGGSNYQNDERSLHLIQPTGANQINLTVNSFDVENTWDYLYIYDGSTVFSPKIGEYTGTSIPSTFIINGNSVLIEFRSDCATTSLGYSISWTAAVPDTVPPTTLVNTPSNWQTSNFTASFNDADNAGGSGLEKSYYQVIDYDGTEWRANENNGFFSDNFNLAIHNVWNQVVGTWSINNGMLLQTDESLGNTNISAPLNQSLSNRYLYHFKMILNGSGTNRRGGLHFFADDDTLSNRGNSYFVWFRVDDAKLQLYKVIGNVFGPPVVDIPLTTLAGQLYDYKVIYDRITGKISIYRDNNFITSWTDSSPIATGNYISFRSGNATMDIDKLKVYRSRYPSVTVSLGSAAADIRYQNPNPATPSGKIKSLVTDYANNISTIGQQLVNVDWTSPNSFTVNDGVASDIDTTNTLAQLSANWSSSSDQHSGLATYWYAIGTTQGDSDVVNWTNNGLTTSITHTGLSLSNNQEYFISIRAENTAGLLTDINSNGQWAIISTGIEELSKPAFQVYPNPFTDNFTIYSQANKDVLVELFDVNGKLIHTEKIIGNNSQFTIQLSKYQLDAGTYLLTLNHNQTIYLIKQ